MSEFADVSKNLNAEMIDKFKTAIETGRWPDGRSVSPEQREIILQAVILYEQTHTPEIERTGSMPDRCASEKTDSIATVNLEALKSPVKH